MKTTVLVRFEIEAESEADAVTVVDTLLDNGVFQDAINENDVADVGDMTVTYAGLVLELLEEAKEST